MFTKEDGTTVIRRWSTMQRTFNRAVYKCNGTEGSSVTIAALVGVEVDRIVDIQRSGTGVEDIVSISPVGLEASYDNGIAGVVGFASDLVNGEFVKVIYQ
ncbi:MAG: hypothetical protein WCG90_08155 [Chitinophagia bacterium]